MDYKEAKQIFNEISTLGIKMRLLKAKESAKSDIGDLKDREILILELLDSEGSMSMKELWEFFRGVTKSTISNDIKRLRTRKKLVNKQLGEHDERVHMVELTEQGIAKVKEIKQQKIKIYAPLIRVLEEHPEDLSHIQNVVKLSIKEVEAELARN